MYSIISFKSLLEKDDRIIFSKNMHTLETEYQTTQSDTGGSGSSFSLMKSLQGFFIIISCNQYIQTVKRT